MMKALIFEEVSASPVDNMDDRVTRKWSERLGSAAIGLAVVAGAVLVTANPALANPKYVGCWVPVEGDLDESSSARWRSKVLLNLVNPNWPDPNTFASGFVRAVGGSIYYRIEAGGWAQFAILEKSTYDATTGRLVPLPQGNPLTGWMQMDGGTSFSGTIPVTTGHYFRLLLQCSPGKDWEGAEGWIYAPLPATPPSTTTPSTTTTTPPPPAPTPAAPDGVYWVDTFDDAPGYSSPASTTQTGTLWANTNYVYCKVWGPEVRVGDDYNHWWLKTDLDEGSPWQNQYVSAYYLSNWGNDEAKDNNGKPIPACEGGESPPPPTPAPTAPPPPVTSALPTTKYWVDTFANAAGYSSPGGSQSGTLYAGTNYVFCRVWGPQVGSGSAYNHWWLLTDLDAGSPWQNQYVSAYYLSRWGNDEAKDNNGTDIANCP